MNVTRTLLVWDVLALALALALLFTRMSRVGVAVTSGELRAPTS